MARVKNFGSKAKARLSKISKALLRRKPKASTALTNTVALNEEARKSSLERVNEASPQPNEEGNLLSGESSNPESSGFEDERPQYRQLPSFGSLSGAIIACSSQFDLPDFADDSVAMLESDPSCKESSPTTSEMEGSTDASSEVRHDQEFSSTANLNSEYAADGSSEIYHHHEISSATDFGSEYFSDTSVMICGNDAHDGTESNKVEFSPKIRIPMVERSEMCLFPRSSISNTSISTANEDAAVNEEDCRYYGFCRGYDFSDSLVVLEDDNFRVGDVEEAEDVDEEFVKTWRARHGYED